MLTNRIISYVYRFLLIIALFTGITLNVLGTSSVSVILSYYTLQSNIICLAFFVFITIISIRTEDYQNNDVYHLLKGSVTITILITGLVYLVALGPTGFEMNINTSGISKFLANFLVHIVSPFMVLLDYFLFDKKGTFKWYYPFIWLIVPLNYLVYVYTYSAHGGHFFGIGGSDRFAYLFLDYTQIGYTGVAEAVVLMGLFILIISFILVFVDKLMGGRK